jgi:hypothetical protein
VDPDKRSVDPDVLGGLRELNGLQQRVSRAARLRPRHVPPVPERKKPDLLHAMDQRRQPRPDSRAERYLQTEPTAPHSSDEVVPLGSRELKDSTPRVLAVPHVDEGTVVRGSLNTVPAAVASGASSPLPARDATVVADALGVRETAHFSPPTALVSDDPRQR